MLCSFVACEKGKRKVTTMAAKLNLSVILCVLAIWVVGYAQAGSAHHAPAPSVDCSSLILNMADCLSYVTNGSTVTKPEGTCCTGLKTVLKADAECLCEAFKSSASLGVVLNVTKATALPAACKVSAPSASNCGCKSLLHLSIFFSVLDGIHFWESFFQLDFDTFFLEN